MSSWIPTQCYNESIDIMNVCKAVRIPECVGAISFTHSGNLNLVLKPDSPKFGVKLDDYDGRNEDLF